METSGEKGFNDSAALDAISVEPSAPLDMSVPDPVNRQTSLQENNSEI